MSLKQYITDIVKTAILPELAVLKQGQLELGADLKLVNGRLDLVDERFRQFDARFDQIDNRLEQMEKRFEQIDKRFDQIDKRFEQVDKRFEQIERRLQELREDVREVRSYVWGGDWRKNTFAVPPNAVHEQNSEYSGKPES